MGRRMASTLALVAALWSGSVMAGDPGSFDGHWNVLVLCPNTPEGVIGYTLRFSADVKGGTLHGQQGTPGQSSSMSLDGTIEPDGTAKLTVKGKTGSGFYTTGNVPSGSPYGYDVTAKFQGARGSGERVGDRVCNYTFTRQ
jgi:hypothetical protein